MIWFHKNCGEELKLERFSYLSGQSFGLSSPIFLMDWVRLSYWAWIPIIVLLLRAGALWERATWCLKKGYGVKVIQSESRHGCPTSLGVDNDKVPQKIVEWYLSLRGRLTYQVDLLGWAFQLGLSNNQHMSSVTI